MEEEQQATQLVIDPRRLGHGNSGLSNDDVADIICILHPNTMPAYRAAAYIHEADPHNTIIIDNNVMIRERGKSTETEAYDNAQELASQGLVACDLALRLSADLKDPLAGFQFGRHPDRCDFVVGQHDPGKRVSNNHFRIYVNEYGVIMLEDQSTNGTGVNNRLLRFKDKENGVDYRHSLENGCMVTLTMSPPDEDWKFIVRIPQRDSDTEMEYQQNLTAFCLRRNNAAKERHTHALAARGGELKPLDLFPSSNSPSVSRGRYVKEWKGGKKYNKIGCIGKGAFAVVYMLTDKFDGKPFAAKELEKRRFMKNGILDQKVDMEMKIMSKIKHPNIVQYEEHVDWEEYLYIIMEYVPGGDLGTLVSDHGHLGEGDVKTMAGQLLGALEYLHGEGITHRDVKPDNILIANSQPFIVKLTDFGLSKMVDSEETFMRTFCGTLLYCAPEVYGEYREYGEDGRRNYRGVEKKSLPPQRYGHAVDIWSLAGVLFYALCGSPPYPVKNGTSYQELLNRIMTQALDIRPLQLANVTDRGIRFIRSMLHKRPEERATIPELMEHAWFVGGAESMSFDEDEVDMIDGGYVDPKLAEGAFQLSIIDPDNHRVTDSQEDYQDGESDLTEVQQIEVPSSFDTSDDLSNGNESYGFIHGAAIPGNGARLFGELNVSAVGSSGAIPAELLPLPAVRGHHTQLPSSMPGESFYTGTQSSTVDHGPEGGSQRVNPAGRVPPGMAPPPKPSNKLQDMEERAARSSSLMGAESMVGHLNMHSPSPVASPAAEASLKLIPDSREGTVSTVSLRRQREDEPEDDEGWKPHDFPSKKRRKSHREIELQLPPSTFWDPRDKSTHHNNYPRMTTSEYSRYQQYAETKGEKFEAGQKTFETTMRSFRTSRSPSTEPEIATRANSEPTREEGRRMLMKRDDRRLFDNPHGHAEVVREPLPNIPDYHTPSTAPANLSTARAATLTSTKILPSSSFPTVPHAFQAPKRILAKFIATPDSILPLITLNITDELTSWGRGHINTLRYSNGLETRIPKYAFKLLLLKPSSTLPSASTTTTTTPSTLPSTTAARIEANPPQDATFFISSKATGGVFINATRLPAHDPQNPYTASKAWAELRHGDVITVWREGNTARLAFRFECYWGRSRETRKLSEGDKVRVLGEGVEGKDGKDGGVLEQVERACREREMRVFPDGEWEKKEKGGAGEKGKGKEMGQQRASLPVMRDVKVERERPNDVHQSFIGVPATTG